MSHNKEDQSQSWEHARAYANLLGTAPSSFTSAIRMLLSDAQKGETLSKPTAFQANRLCNSPSLGASLVSAAKSIYPELNIVANSELVTKLPPLALAGLIGVAFLYRKAKKLANEEEWPHYTKVLPARSDLCSIIGKNIEQIGVARGIIMGLMDTVAVTCFHLHDKKGFTEYRRALKAKNLREDIGHELERWGCTRYHVGAILVQGLGFGIEFSNEYAVGMLAEPSEENNLKSSEYKFFIGKVWLEALQKDAKEPNRAMRVEFYPQKSGLDAIIEAGQKILKNPPSICWLDAVKAEAEVLEDGE